MQRPVLIVEDDIYILESLEAIFEMEHYPVLKASNGQEALDLLKAIKNPSDYPGVIYVDYMMPVMNGQKFVNETQSEANNFPFKDIPVVILSAGLSQMVGKITGRVDKPATIEELLSFARLYCHSAV